MPMPDFLKLCETRYGTMLCNTHDLYIGRSLLTYGEFSQPELDLLLPFIKPDAVVLDIGANIGTHTLAFARAANTGVVVAFEPQRFVFQMLNANLALNGIFNVMTVQQGAGAKHGHALIPIVQADRDGNFGAVAMNSFEVGDNVPVMPLDALSLGRLDLLKIDVEGMEVDVLQGIEKTIQRCQPLLYIENDRVEKSPAVLKYLFDAGYDVWWHVVPYFNDKNYNKQTENIFKNVIGINVLAAPKAAALSITAPNTQKVSHADEHPLNQIATKRSLDIS